MAVFGTNSENAAMKIACKELEVDGIAVLGTQAATIADVTVTGTYADDDDAIETAINAIIAALVAAGIVAAA